MVFANVAQRVPPEISAQFSIPLKVQDHVVGDMLRKVNLPRTECVSQMQRGSAIRSQSGPGHGSKTYF